MRHYPVPPSALPDLTIGAVNAMLRSLARAEKAKADAADAGSKRKPEMPQRVRITPANAAAQVAALKKAGF